MRQGLRSCIVVGLALAGAAQGAALWAADAAPNTYCDVTVSAGPWVVKQCDFIVAERGGKVQILLDAFPYRDDLKGKDADALQAAALDLVRTQAVGKYPSAKAYKVAIVEVPERDSYGLPRWDTLKILKKFVFVKDKKGALSLEPEPTPAAAAP